jgi:hypothetical protein
MVAVVNKLTRQASPKLSRMAMSPKKSYNEAPEEPGDVNLQGLLRGGYQEYSTSHSAPIQCPKPHLRSNRVPG